MTTRSARTLLAAVGAVVVLGLIAPPAFAQAVPQSAPSAPAQGQGNGQGSGQGLGQPKPKPTKSPGTNNGFPGTIKVADPLANTAPGNEPHPGCSLRVDFYGFNLGPLSVTISGQAPTATDQPLSGGTVVITQPRKGGQFQQSATFDLNSALATVTPTAQGYHLKVTVVDPDKPGNGGKQKVLWLNCAPLTPRSLVAPNSSGLGGGTVTAGDVTTAVKGTRTTRKLSAAAPTATVLGTRLLRSSGVLPRTGLKTTAMLWIGIAVLQWGLILMAGARFFTPRKGIATA
ncbi:MAG: hypothetical protein ABR520_11060 [Mycobacteriales bacterium]|nr:hypothetical protein [Frankia sp.]